MILNRMVFLLIFSALGALAFGWWKNDQRIISAQNEKVNQFISAGGRFTTNDGKELCEFANIIAVHSIGFQQSGLPLMDCEKYSRGIK